MMQRVVSMVVAAVCMGLASSGGGQEKAGRLEFEVASIRPTNPNEVNGFIKPLAGGNGYTAKNIPVKLMISLMYKVPMRQISGGPDWMGSDRYDVEAKADHAYGADDLHTMYQNMLADRFGLKFHKEVKEGPVYSLTVDKSGLKMKENRNPDDFSIPVNFGPEGLIGKRVPMVYLCWLLGQQLQWANRPVVNDTGLTGNYDFTLDFAPVRPPDAAKEDTPSDKPSLFDALREQLGLKLTAQKGPVEYYVIDHVEKPSAN